MSAIVVENLKKIFKRPLKSEGFKGLVRFYFKQEYEKIEALKGVSFEVKEGQIFTILGPNGAGKTTILKILSGIIHPTDGYVRVLGHSPQKREKDFLRKIGFLSSQKRFAQFIAWDLPAVDLFRLVKAIYDIDENTYRKRLDSIIESLEVGDYLEVPIRKLSLGQRAKIELIAAILHYPEVLFLDEPTLGLDIIAARDLREFIKNYVNETNATVVLTSHYMKDIEDLSDELIILDRGEIVFHGDLEKIYEKFSMHRLVKFVLEEEFKGELPEADKLIRKDTNTVVYKIAADETRRFVKSFIDRFEVKDVTVEDEDLEDVIGRIYRG